MFVQKNKYFKSRNKEGIEIKTNFEKNTLVEVCALQMLFSFTHGFTISMCIVHGFYRWLITMLKQFVIFQVKLIKLSLHSDPDRL